MNRVHRYLGQEPAALDTLAAGIEAGAAAAAGTALSTAQKAACAPLVEEEKKKAKTHALIALALGGVVGFFVAKKLG